MRKITPSAMTILPRMDEDLEFLDRINADCAAHAAARKQEQEASRAARAQKQAENKAKLNRARRINWWLGLVHWIIHYFGCGCILYVFWLCGMPATLAAALAVVILAEFCWITRRLIKSRPRKEK